MDMDITLSEDDPLIDPAAMDPSYPGPHMSLLPAPVPPEPLSPFLGMEFDTDEAAKEFYTAYADRVGFSVRMNKSRRSRRDDSVIMRRFVCTREGFHSKRLLLDDGKKKRKRATSRQGCPAMIEVIRKDPGTWLVTKLLTDHTHPVALPSPPTFNPLTNADSTTPKNITKTVRNNPFGEGGEAAGLLDYLQRTQADNPGFFYAVQVDNNNCMTNVFWADARSRTAYQRFGDSVTFDTTYKKTKYMMPFATFRGVNHHLQPVNFGCALLMDETKGSYIWLFDTWLAAMGGRHPDSLVTDRDKAVEGAITRVFPNTRNCLCRWHILSRCKQKIGDVYQQHHTLKNELKECVNESETVEEFETRWEYILANYNLWDNQYLQSLYEIRQQWALVYQKDVFFPELSPSQRPESLNKFFRRNFDSKPSLLVFIAQFDQEMTARYELEAQADLAVVYAKLPLKTPSPIEKQAAEVYTSAVFERFQEEFVESLGYYANKIEDGPVSKYSVTKEEDGRINYIVSFSESNKEARCNCYKFERSGILCRHVLRVFFIVGVRVLPEVYILKRWSRNATSRVVLQERVTEPGLNFQEYLVTWYNDLSLDAIKYGTEGAISSEVYKVAKAALQKAFNEVVSAKNMQRKGQQNLQRFARLQKMQHKMPLPKLQPNKTPASAVQQDESSRSKGNAEDDTLYVHLISVFLARELFQRNCKKCYTTGKKLSLRYKITFDELPSLVGGGANCEAM